MSSSIPFVSTKSAAPTADSSIFFPSPSSLVPPPNPESTKAELAKSVVEWVFMIMVILLAVMLFSWRIARLRMERRPLKEFLSCGSGSRCENTLQSAERYYPRTIPINNRNSTSPPTGFVYPDLYPIYSPHLPQSSRAVGMGTDAHGRRLDSGAGDDETVEDKDTLPPYEGGGGPPRYLETIASNSA